MTNSPNKKSLLELYDDSHYEHGYDDYQCCCPRCIQFEKNLSKLTEESNKRYNEQKTLYKKIPNLDWE